MQTTTIVRKTWRPPLICRVCGDTARGMNFGVMSCMSCKAFFRRNALRPMGTLRCTKKFNCEVARETRSLCPACRLKKCLTLGMKPQLIHRFLEHQMPTPRPLDLLYGDRSTLSIDEWNWISNMIHMFDRQNSMSSFKILLDGRLLLPPKMRAKPKLLFDCARHVASSTETYFRQAILIYPLSAEARQAFVTRNMIGVVHFHGLFLARESEALENTYFLMSLDQIQGSVYMERLSIVLQGLDRNGTLIKLMLFIMILSSNCSVLMYDNEQNMLDLSVLVDVIAIQDTLVSILWKYLIYQYSFTEATLRYSSLIKCLTDLVNLQAMFKNKELANILENVIEKTEQSLVIED